MKIYHDQCSIFEQNHEKLHKYPIVKHCPIV